MLIKKIARKIMPNRLHPLARKIYSKISNRTKPRFSMYLNNSEQVLNCVVAYNKYGGYCVPRLSMHRPAAQKILSGDVYEPETIEFIISNCKGGDIVHAGTYFGDFLPALSTHCKQKIWAFEPNKENYQCAKITVLINGLENIELTNACLGEKQGSVVLVTSDQDGVALGGASRVLMSENNNMPQEKRQPVDCAAIDEVIPHDRNVSIIHLDVERYEQKALSGAMNTIQRCKPIIILEHLPEKQWLSENILSLGYQQKFKVNHNKVFIP